MKVLLIRPEAPNKLSFTKILDNEPLELEYLHTGLQQAGFSDYIYDGLIETISVIETIRREKPDIIAVTGYITQENLMLKYCNLAKAYDAKCKTVLGGVHAQLNHERFYHADVDYICRSESLNAFVSLVSLINMEEASGTKLREINGLCFKDERINNYIVNPLVAMDINTLPIPDRTFFYQHKESYRYLDLTEVGTIKTSFSCPYSCNFCYCSLLNGGKYQERNLDLVIEELEHLDTQNIQIVDDDFLINKERLWDFIRRIKEKKIKKTYTCYARADFVAENPKIIQALSEIGFKYFLVGLEAVSDKELVGYNKGTSLNHNVECVRVIQTTTASCIGLMIAPIDATKDYFNRLYQWVVDNNLKYVTVSIFTPIPGTPLYEELKSSLTTTNIEEWDFLHLVLEPLYLTRREFYMEYYKLFIRLYKIAKKTGIYDFMDLEFYHKMLKAYFARKIKGD